MDAGGRATPGAVAGGRGEGYITPPLPPGEGRGEGRAAQNCTSSPGIRALLEVAGRKPGKLGKAGLHKNSDITASDLGFVVAPRLNAAGRLTDMSLGIECLLTENETAAFEMAKQLDTLNRERRGIEAGMQQQALAALDAFRLSEADANLPRGLCLFDESWHQGVIGILAARIKDRLHRPVIAFAPANADEIKGSARSVPGLHIRDALEACATRHGPAAAKIRRPRHGRGPEPAPPISRRSAPRSTPRSAATWTRPICGRLWTDGELGADDLALDFAETLRHAGPWGQGFPEPLFDGRFEVVGTRGRREASQAHARHRRENCSTPSPLTRPRRRPRTADAAGGLSSGRVNEYQGNRRLQLIIEQLTPV